MSVVANPMLTDNEVNLERLQVESGYYRAPYVRPNLLDNWYFVGGGDQQGSGIFPINQQKQTSYAVNGYTIDRWRLWNANITATLTSDGITLHSVDPEKLRNFATYLTLAETAVLSGQTITVSALIGSELYALKTISGVTASIDVPGGVLSSKLGISGTLISVQISINPSQTISNIKAIKMELGDTQTLCHNEGTEANPIWVLNEIPNYGEQLLRCQRHYHIYRDSSKRPTYAVDCRPVMRVDPIQGSFTYDGTTYYYNDANL